MASVTETERERETRIRAFEGIGARSVGATLGVAALLVCLALASYHPADATFWNASDEPTRNWLGAFGAQFAAILRFSVGLAAWLLPLALAVWCWRLMSGRWERVVSMPLRLLPAGTLALLGGGAFLSALPGGIAPGLGLGGWIGDRTIRPFAILFEDLGFSAPYQIPGLGFVLLAAAALALACGVSRHEAGAAISWLGGSFRSLFSREKRVQYAETTLKRTHDLTKRLRGGPREALSPPTLDGIVPLRATREASVETGDSDAPEIKPKRKRRSAKGDADTATAARQLDLPLDRDQRVRTLLSLLAPPERNSKVMSQDEMRSESDMLLRVLNDYGVSGEIVGSKQGPVVTLHEFDPAAGTKASRVVGLADDIARSMSALSARVAPIRGRSVIGIELPNKTRDTVFLREIMERAIASHIPLPLALGQEIDGTSKCVSLTKMPHLLIAGTTGSGKSVSLNAMILSLLYRHTPEECRMIMIDPKMLELSVYDGIPHLLAPVVTDPKKAVMALKWVVREMESRYQRMAAMNVRNLDGYNLRMKAALENGETLSRDTVNEFGEIVSEEIAPEPLPYIVVIVDEMADLMMVAGKEIEACIQRLAQMARASGIHLIMATQRPSVDVITGTIKANFPTRISFQVTSKIDSRTILGEQGAEQLLGQGDMLYMAGGGRITRVHGPFVSDDEVHRIAEELRRHGEPGDQVSFNEPGERDSEIDEILGLGGGSDDDALYDQAVAIVAKDRRATTSYIQRRLQIGYNRAARLIESMEEQGVISPPNNAGKREVLIEER